MVATRPPDDVPTTIDPADLAERLRGDTENHDDVRAAILEESRLDLSATIALLSRADTPDAVRVFVLETLVPVVAPSDLLVLARAAGGQRPGVTERLAALLANRSEAEAALLLRAVIAPRAPQLRAQIDVAAARILGGSPAAHVLHGQPDPGVQESRQGELGALVVATPFLDLADAREEWSPALQAAIGEELSHLDDGLRTGTTAEGDRLLRSAVYAAVVVGGCPDDGELARRASEWLFRLDDVELLSEVAPHLPEAAAQRYVERSLTRKNRRGERVGRAVFAMTLLRDHASTGVQRATRDLVIECLDEDDVGLRAGALRALDAQASDLDLELRERVVATYAALDATDQAAIAGDMRAIPGQASQLDDEALIRWAASAPDDEVEARLESLLAHWRSGAPSVDRVEEFIQTAGSLSLRLDPDVASLALDDVVRTAARWVRGQGSRLVAPLEALRTWPGFSQAAATRASILIGELRAEQARRMLLDVGRAGPEQTARVASADVDRDAVERLILPSLVALIGGSDAPQALEAWHEEACTVDGCRRLVAAAILAIGGLKRSIADLSSNASSAELAALDERLRGVLGSLEEAETDGAGNDVLLEHFFSLRRSISGLLSDDEAREPTDRVQEWRRELANRHPQLVRAPENGRQVLQIIGDPRAHAEDLSSILLELDQRVHNPRVLGEIERADTADDLDAVASSVARADMLTAEGPLSRVLGRPALGQVLLARWAESLGADAPSYLGEELARLADPSVARAALQRVDALAGAPSDNGAALTAVGALEDDQLEPIWKGVSAALRQRLKEEAGLKNRERSRDAEAMERVAERMDPPMRSIEALLFSYFRFRSLLGQAGWLPLEAQLGTRIPRERVQADLHEIQGDRSAPAFVVRSLGLKAKGQVVARAVLEPEKRDVTDNGGTT